MEKKETARDHVLKAEHLQVGYDKKVIVQDMSITIPDHKISVIIGSNGCGKSTLLKAFARLLPPMKGEILLDGRSYSRIPSKKLAQIIGLLPQSPLVPEGIKVSDLVSRGRYPYHEAFRGMTKEDFRAVDEAMEMMGVAEYADCNVDELSGGQRQRVWIAMTLAQQTDILFLDEPTTYLDITYQIEILDLLAELNRTKKMTIVMVLHDINLSARYADYLFALAGGKLAAAGRPGEILSEQLIWDIFRLECVVIEDPVSRSPHVIPKGRFCGDARRRE
ncbi:MAG: ABC transporter ATP-binding protein [Eubacteriales bacterium]|nr:ABC transporter ATP-binding protein [Eubacteriales bacterium]